MTITNAPTVTAGVAEQGGRVMSTSEKTIQARILAAIGSLPWLRIWRNNTGQAWTGNKVEQIRCHTTISVGPGDVVIRRAHPIRFGTPGSADLTGILSITGQRLEVEVKTPTGRQSTEQKNYQKMIETLGGVYVLARSEGEIVDQILEKIT